MTKTFSNANCKFNATSTGTGAFVVASAIAPYATPDNAGALDGHVYEYYAETANGSQWESGIGTWTLATHTLARTTIESNSLLGFTAINFATVPQVDVFHATMSLEPSAFTSGTLMLFQQSSAPPGWTKQTTHNDKALRVVSGAASSGGTNAFSTVMAQTTVGNHTLSVAELASHNHATTSGGFVSGCPGASDTGIAGTGQGDGSRFSLSFTGSGTAHSHPITMSIQYVDLIICQKT